MIMTKRRIKMYRYYTKNPWAKHYARVQTRCSFSKYYLTHGIKLLMKTSDFKELWFRDKAWLLAKPSIDRIDSHGNYELKNCRFIEYKDNVLAGSMQQRKPVVKYNRQGEIVGKYESIRKAANDTGSCRDGIIACCKGEKTSYYGFGWRFA